MLEVVDDHLTPQEREISTAFFNWEERGFKSAWASIASHFATLTQERDALRLHVERLDAALEECWFNDDTTLSLPEWKVELLTQADFKIFSARAALASPEEKPEDESLEPCPKCGHTEKVQAGDPAIHECDRCYHCWRSPEPPSPYDALKTRCSKCETLLLDEQVVMTRDEVPLCAECASPEEKPE